MNQIQPTATIIAELDTNGVERDYDFRVSYLGVMLLDLKLDEVGYDSLGDGPQLIERLKIFAYSVIEDQITKPEGRILLELLIQKFRRYIQEGGETYGGDNPLDLLRRKMEISFLM